MDPVRVEQVTQRPDRAGALGFGNEHDAVAELAQPGVDHRRSEVVWPAATEVGGRVDVQLAEGDGAVVLRWN